MNIRSDVRSFACILLAIFLIAPACGRGNGDLIISGLYYWGGEVESISLCNGKEDYWVSGQDSVLEVMRAQSEVLAMESGAPYQPVYVELTGRFVGKAEDGFASEYDDVFEVYHARILDQDRAVACKRPEEAG